MLNNTSKSKSPLLYTTTVFVEKLIERGFCINLKLRNKLMQIDKDFNNKNNKTESLEIYWNTESVQKEINHYLDNQDSNIRINNILSILSSLSKYNINYINLAVILWSLSIQEIRNLYRYYYLEWININKNSTLFESKIIWKYTPREFNLLESTQIYNYWLHFIKQFISPNNHSLHIFFINRFYKYMTPFV
tara:strand:- start:443 stop:1015 length:573 start_codon:yes stop_codon:yes gene_type:complete